MIPSVDQAKAFWEKYQTPPNKRTHLELVASVALFLAHAYEKKHAGTHVDVGLLQAAALLHDIDKSVAKLPGEQHPDTAVRILREEGMPEVARLVETHPLHTILDPALQLKTLEEKLLFLADKMVKYEIITVDKRFDLWRNENLAPEVRSLVEESYPKVKALEKEIFDALGIIPADIAKLAQQ
jgi:putative nucleotidyltransferase with HDIG domain